MLRRLLLALGLLAGLAGVAQAQVGFPAGSPQWLRSDGSPGWILPAAVADFDFVADRSYQRGKGTGSSTAFLTVSRASGGAAFDAAGNLVQFGTNVARRTNLGLLIEESRTNLITQGTFQSGWNSNSNGAITFNAVTSPAGSTNAATVSCSSSCSGSSGVYYNAVISVTNGSAYTASLLAKYLSGNVTAKIGNDSNGATGNSTINIQTCSLVSSGAQVTATFAQLLSNGWCYLSVSFTAASTTASFIIYDGASSPFSAAVFAAGIEPGSFATSPILTSGSAATRAADVIYATGVQAPQYLTLYGAGTPMAPANYGTLQGILELGDGTSNNRLDMVRNSSTGQPGSFYVTAGTAQGLSIPGAWAQSNTGKIAASYASGSQKLGFLGSVNQGTSSQAIPSVLSKLWLGATTNGAAPCNCYITRAAGLGTTSVDVGSLTQ